MGLVKNLYLKDLDRGYYYPGEKYVCKGCFEDYAIRAYINENVKSNVCDYCGKKSNKKPIAAPLENVIGFIVEGIETEWGDPNDEGVGWCSAEGGWISAKVTDTYDLLIDEFDFGDLPDKLFKDILDSIVSKQLCQKDPHALPPHEQIYFNWERFSEQVKHQIRYVFYRTKVVKKSGFEFEEKSEPYEILDYIGHIAEKFDLIHTLPVGTKFICARIHNNNQNFLTVEELGPPPKEKSVSTRMSPTGIPIFYGSTDEKTAIVETFNKRHKSNSFATVVTFKIVKEFKVLDLTKLPEVPSLFDEGMRHLRTPLFFLYSFRRDIIKSIENDGREHIEYVPTQIVSEYFRHVYRDHKGDTVKGIIYPSSVVGDGISCALFFQNENFVQDKRNERSNDEKWIKMLPLTIKKIDLKKYPF